MSKLFNSRKFLVLVLDAVFGLAALAIVFFVAEDIETQAFVLAVFGILQPVFVGVIKGITQEDAAQIAAGSHPSQINS